MERFNYLAADDQGKQIKGAVEANDLLDAQTKLRHSGLYIIRVSKENNLKGKFYFSRIKNPDLSIFCHQFSVLVSSGVPLVRSLKALAQETPNIKFRYIINQVRQDVENGSSLSGALYKYPDVFSNFFVSLIKGAETAGILPEILSKLADYLEKEEDLRRKVSASFAYPIVVGFVAFGSVSFLLIFVVPVFVKVYKSLKLGLPGPTVALIILSDIFIKFWWLILLVIASVFYIFKLAEKKESVGLILDRVKLKIPLFGRLNRKVAVSRFVRLLSTLIGSGVTLGASLEIVKNIVGNKAIASEVGLIHHDIIQGSTISHSLKMREFFPPIVAQMVSVGEESGNLKIMLEKCADFLDEEIDTFVKQLIVKLEPILTLFLAALVSFIALAIYLPMFDLVRNISR